MNVSQIIGARSELYTLRQVGRKAEFVRFTDGKTIACGRDAMTKAWQAVYGANIAYSARKMAFNAFCDGLFFGA